MGNLLVNGALLGLTLSFMVGPLLFAIVQASIERGFRAGVAVAAGIWISDVIFVLAVYRSVAAIETLTTLPGFKFWAGICGGLVLLLFGAANFLPRRLSATDTTDTAADKLLDVLDGHEPTDTDHNWKRWGYFGWWLRGFLLNTINPFTVFFWLGVAGGIVIPNQWGPWQVLLFFGGMLGTLVVTDTMKAYAAKRVRGFLTPGHIRWVRRGIGLMLIVFGLILVIRVM